MIDLIVRATPGQEREETVDTVKYGDPSQKIRGIVTTFMATCDVIKRAGELGANLVINHEPTFYNHRDETGWLSGDRVYEHKRRLLDSLGIVVWRCHDYWHMHNPDPVKDAFLNDFGWSVRSGNDDRIVIYIKEVKLRELASHIKDVLRIPSIRVVGNLEMACNSVGVLPGASGGMSQIRLLSQKKPDVLICGEVSEWETSEYARDAVSAGLPVALVVTGHAVSEEAGMRCLVDWSTPKVPGIQVTHVPALDPFVYL